jgi:hypothetical protein
MVNLTIFENNRKINLIGKLILDNNMRKRYNKFTYKVKRWHFASDNL